MNTDRTKSKPAPIDPEAPTLDVEGAARLLALRPSTIRKLVGLRTLPFYKLGSRVAFDRDELIEWRNAHRVAPTEAI